MRKLLLCCLYLMIVSCHSPRDGKRYKKEKKSIELKRPRELNNSKNEEDQNGANRKILTGSEIFKKYGKSVFMIVTSDGAIRYQGSGFFIGKNGLAVSNYHVFKGTAIGGEYIKLFDEETLYKVSDVVYKSEDHDIMIFHVNCENPIYIPMAKEKPNVGDKVYAIGSPRGLENTFSSGEVSQWRGEYLMQINVKIDHGSSGGALINEYGEVVGITSGTLCDGSPANLNYAWSIEAIKNLHY
ncbi:MAG: serine protease [Bacteroidales bacterium]|nr:serine protease [Bacteroidales bacterium]